ncbi:ROK family protein [Spongiactinospora sp. TRM90649]|uniref:ROK family protein n=1 Tax=Spongiactinospora sp. TRM90649 TaxID=3031114 RepID=UPI0023F75003|nr:ROK family protein [Spongiactinospora sp. TRM90649]MDF5755780.1 ROK family protein [Spongiactinospora sp. TRM90649]
MRVAVDNNARLAALAEATLGVGRPMRDMVYVRWSVGVGGEMGHVSLDAEGPPCHCGSRGCLEGRIGCGRLLAECAIRGVELRA